MIRRLAHLFPKILLFKTRYCQNIGSFLCIDRTHSIDYIMYMRKSRATILEKIRRNRKNFLYGTLIAGASLGGIKGYQALRFELAALEILKSEGGYDDGTKTDQETKFGITNPTLTDFKEKFPDEAKGFPESVKNLSLPQAKTIMRVAFYEHYKLNELHNASLSEMLLDAVYNHDYKTFRSFAKEGLIAVMKMRGEDIEKRPRNWKEIPLFLNNCSDKEQEAFYNAFVQARIDFFEKKGYINKFKGLKKRARKFVGKYRSCPLSQNMDILPNENPNTLHWFDAIKLAQKGRN